MRPFASCRMAFMAQSEQFTLYKALKQCTPSQFGEVLLFLGEDFDVTHVPPAPADIPTRAQVLLRLSEQDPAGLDLVRAALDEVAPALLRSVENRQNSTRRELTTPDPSAGPPHSVGSTTELEASYREVLCEGLDQVPFAGLYARHPPHARVRDLFVPLEFQLANPEPTRNPGRALRQHVLDSLMTKEGVIIGEPATFSTEWLVSVARSGLHKELSGSPPSEARRERPTRLIILGAPGSGKSLLSRALALALAEESASTPVQHLPLFLAFRDLGVEDVKKPLADLLYTGFQRYYVEPQRSWFNALLREGRAVLVLDGLDELGDASTRIMMCQRVRELCAAFKRLRVIITSRVTGYDEARLDAASGFETLRVRPFSDRAIERFCENWSRVSTVDGTKLLRALRGNRGVWTLARTPLLATISAIVFAEKKELPNDVGGLYESFVVTLLETWPRNRGVEFKALSVDEQRTLLEWLALSTQEARTDAGHSVVFERAELASYFSRVLSAAQGADRNSLELARVVEAWLVHLERSTGLLIEEVPGQFAFLHLSFVEYLAAARLGRMPTDTVAKFVHERFERSTWHQTFKTLLRAIGGRALAKEIVTEFCVSNSRIESLLFLFDFELEREWLPSELFEVLLRALVASPHALLARLRVGQVAGRSSQDSALLREVILDGLGAGDFAMVQRAGTWLPWRGSTVQSIPVEPCVEHMAERGDAEQLAPWLLGFGATHPLGRWAMTSISTRDAITWSKEESSQDDHALLDALLTLLAEGVAQASHVGAALTQALGEQVLRRLASIVEDESVGPSVLVLPGEYNIPTWPLSHARAVQPASPRQYTRFFAGDSWRQAQHPDLTRYRALATIEHPPSVVHDVRWIRYSDIHNRRERTKWFGSAEDVIWAGELVNLSDGYDLHGAGWLDPQSLREKRDALTHEHVVEELARAWDANVAAAAAEVADDEDDFLDFEGPATGPDGYFREEMDSVLDQLVLEPRLRPVRVPAPAELAVQPRILAAFRDHSSQDNPLRDFCELASRHVAELMVSMATSVGLDEPTRAAYVDLRQQARWLLENFDAIEHWIAAFDTPLAVGFELALGWIQCLTTYSWPATARWRGHFGGGAPAHWFARAHWYIAWLLHAPSSEVYSDGLEAALSEGLEDVALRPLALQLQNVLSLLQLPRQGDA